MYFSDEHSEYEKMIQPTITRHLDFRDMNAFCDIHTMISVDYDMGKSLVDVYSVECKSSNRGTGLNLKGSKQKYVW